MHVIRWLTDNVNCSRGCPGKFQVIIFEVDGKVPDSDEINYDAWYVRLFILSNKLIKRIVQPNKQCRTTPHGKPTRLR